MTFKKAQTEFPVDIHMLPMSKPTASKEDPFTFVDMVQYFFVGTTDKKAEANMIEDIIVKRGINVPVLKNNKDLEPYTQLLRFKPKVLPAAPKGGPPAKKAKVMAKVV